MGKFIVSEEDIKRINKIVRFLARRDIGSLESREIREYYGIKEVDLIILLGNSIPFIGEKTARAYKKGLGKKLMIAGGKEHSTKYLWENVKRDERYQEIKVQDRAEADIFKDIIVKLYDIDEGNILVENRSNNCGANAQEALKLFKEKGLKAKSILLIQDPTMQLRTYASFLHNWKEEDVTFINYAPFVPLIKKNSNTFSFKEEIPGIWDKERFLSLLMGEIPRLRDDKDGYGPRGKGFIAHVDIPDEVLAAYKQLLPHFRKYLEIRDKG